MQWAVIRYRLKWIRSVLPRSASQHVSATFIRGKLEQWRRQRGAPGAGSPPRWVSTRTFYQLLEKNVHVVISTRLFTTMKRHLQFAAIDAFSGLLMCPKCIWGRGSALNPVGELTALPRPRGCWGGDSLTLHETPPRSRPSASNFGPSGLRSAPLKTNCWLRHW